MVFGKQAVWVGALAVAVAGVGMQGQSAQTQAAPAGQQSVPDAPRPQTLPQLNTITPAAPALPNAPAAEAEANGGQAAPGSSTPSTPAPNTETRDEGPPPDMPSTPVTVIHVPVNFVEVPFTVKDSKGQLVPGLTWRDVRVYENGVRQQMRYFTTDPFPLSVALVIDQSVTYDTMNKINNALDALQGAFAPYDEVAVFTYNNGVREQTDFLAAQSARLSAIIDRSKATGREPMGQIGGPLADGLVINDQAVDPNTNGRAGQTGIQLNPPKEFHTLNDAILAAAESMARVPRGRRRIVYVISDGKEYGSTASEKEVIRYCQTNNIAVYATLVGDSSLYGMGFLDRIHLPLTMRDNALPRYTAATGGQLDAEFRQGGIEKSFARIMEQVRTQYTVGYYSHEPILDGKFRSVTVNVMRPNLDVIAKKGYYPTAVNAGTGSGYADGHTVADAAT